MHTEDKYMINDQVCVGIPTYQPNIEKLIKTINLQLIKITKMSV